MHSDAAIETALSNTVNYIPMCHEILPIICQTYKTSIYTSGYETIIHSDESGDLWMYAATRQIVIAAVMQHSQ